MKKKTANDNGKTALTRADAIEVWQMHWNGMFQHHIAQRFGVNPGRVNEVLKERRHVGSREEAAKLFKRSA
jgi:hypothetical protein